jgi:hypothetical protein
MSRALVPVTWTWLAVASAIGGFIVVAGNATGAVDRCNGQAGFAPVPVWFWVLESLSVASTAAAVLLAGRAPNGRRTAVVCVVVVTLIVAVSLVVYWIGYSCAIE